MQTLAGVCTVGGSSGGAVYRHHAAYGILVLRDVIGCIAYYTRIRDVERVLNVDLKTG